MATTNRIDSTIETVQPSYEHVGIRPPIVFACTAAVPFLLLLWWWLS